MGSGRIGEWNKINSYCWLYLNGAIRNHESMWRDKSRVRQWIEHTASKVAKSNWCLFMSAHQRHEYTAKIYIPFHHSQCSRSRNVYQTFWWTHFDSVEAHSHRVLLTTGWISNPFPVPHTYYIQHTCLFACIDVLKIVDTHHFFSSDLFSAHYEQMFWMVKNGLMILPRKWLQHMQKVVFLRSSASVRVRSTMEWPTLPHSISKYQRVRENSFDRT